MSDVIQTNMITRDAFVRASSAELLEKRQVEFVISSESIDTYRTVFKMDGGDFSRFENGGIVLYMHDAWSNDADNVLGVGEVFMDGDELIGRVTFEPKEVNEKAEKIFRKIESGTPYMASIGANVHQATFGVEDSGEDPDILYFRKWSLLEFSVVPIGANPDAKKRSVQNIEAIKKEIRSQKNSPIEDLSQDNNHDKISVQHAQLIVNQNKYLK